MLAGIVTLLTRKHEQNLSTFSHFILIRASYWHLHTHFKLLTHVIHLNLTHVKRILINLRQKVKQWLTLFRTSYCWWSMSSSSASPLPAKPNIYSLRSRTLSFLLYYVKKGSKLLKIYLSELFNIIGNLYMVSYWYEKMSVQGFKIANLRFRLVS